MEVSSDKFRVASRRSRETSNIQHSTSNVESRRKDAVRAKNRINLRAQVCGFSVEPFIGKSEVARRLDRTVRAVERLIRLRAIPYYKFDWRVAFRWSEIQTHFAANFHVLPVSPSTSDTNHE
jgi:hypothetical protein